MRAAAAIGGQGGGLVGAGTDGEHLHALRAAGDGGHRLAVRLGHRGVPVGRRRVHPGPGHPARTVQEIHLSPQPQTTSTPTVATVRGSANVRAARPSARRSWLSRSRASLRAAVSAAVSAWSAGAAGLHVVVGDDPLGAAGDGE